MDVHVLVISCGSGKFVMSFPQTGLMYNILCRALSYTAEKWVQKGSKYW